MVVVVGKETLAHEGPESHSNMGWIGEDGPEIWKLDETRFD